MTTLEGQSVPVDVVETYVPFMEAGRFRGAFEFYFDVTGRKRVYDQLVLHMALMVGIGMAIILVMLVFTAMKGVRVERERTAAEEDLVASERRFRTVLEQAPFGICIVQYGKVVYFNRPRVRMIQPLVEALEKRGLDRVHPDDADRFRLFAETLAAGDILQPEIEFRCWPEAGRRGRQEMRWIHCVAGPVTLDDRPAVVVSMADVSEARRLEAHMRTQDKLASLGRMSAGIAHEIRNPLSGVNLNLAAVRELVQNAPDAAEMTAILDQALAAARRIEIVIKRVMDFARPSEPALRPGDVNAPVRAAAELSAAVLAKQQIALDLELTPGLPACPIDTVLIEQVLINLITNAADALQPATGRRLIRIATVRQPDGVRIRVADSGPGIPAAALEEVFEPFYTTKKGSTGIGLSLCRRIVGDHHGVIYAGAAEIGGAEFVIDLPAARSNA